MDHVRRLRIHAPAATDVRVVVRSCHGPTEDLTVVARREGDEWVADASVETGDLYWIVADGGPPLLDPSCLDLELTTEGPRSVVRDRWPRRPAGAPLASPPIVYEMHVRGFGGSFLGCIEHLDHVAAVGANVVELMPVHPFDPADNYWGYMPLVWGAVHRSYATAPERAAEELAELIAAIHDRGMHAWLDVVFNHTGEGDATKPTYSLRGLDDAHAYRHHDDGRYIDDSGCGNDANPADPYVRLLVLEALDRYADLGVDGFRFDLASLLTRDGGELVRRITTWAASRGVALIAEPWDLGSYQLGADVWPATWLQWNDRFRDDVRGFLRAEPGLVGAVRRRVQGSPDQFGNAGPWVSLNFVTAHDGLTMHDLTLVTSDRHHSWDCGDDLRLQQLQNYFTVLLLSAGTPMWVMGDEFGRTQQGHDNPYDIDGPLTWVDWGRAADWHELTEFVTALVALRRQHPPTDVRCYGTAGDVDESFESRSIAWAANGLYVMANVWWEPLAFTVREPGQWQQVLATADPTVAEDGRYHLAPRSIVVLRR